MKRIVICADGTWNQRDQVKAKTGSEGGVDKASSDPTRRRSSNRRPTNVTKLARAVLPRAPDGVDQVVYYHSGVGTGGPLDKLTGGAFGNGMEANIREMYRFIVYNHVQGDELYFFGFSRGAFTVRTLAGFMNKLGLVSKADDYYVPDLYACYEKKGAGPDSEEWKWAFHRVNQALWRPCPPIKFIGVWDTVGSLGAPGLLGRIFNRNRYGYHDVSLNEHIQNAVHAMAIDERRGPFLPTLWERPKGWTGQLVQAWFAGVHSDIGGGYRPDGLANEALHWLVEHAERLGLALDAGYLAPFKPFFNSTAHDSMGLMYRVGAVDRPIGKFRAHGEAIHQSALDRMRYADCAYAPANLRACMDAAGGAKLPIVNTTRVARGMPYISKSSGVS